MQSTSSRPVAPPTDAEERTGPAGDAAGPSEDPVLEDLLVEDVSIDGMCGVY